MTIEMRMAEEFWLAAPLPTSPAKVGVDRVCGPVLPYPPLATYPLVGEVGRGDGDA